MAQKRLSVTWLNERVQVTTGGMIASLWRKMVRSMGYTEHDVDRLIVEAIRRDKERRMKDTDYATKVKDTHPSTLRKDVRNSSTMTIKSFLRLMQYVLLVDDIEIIVRATKKQPFGDDVRHHEAAIRIPSNMVISDIDDEEDDLKSEDSKKKE